MKIETIEIFGFVSAIRAVRLPFKGTNITDSKFVIRETISKYSNIHFDGYSLDIGSKDLVLLQKLIKNGDEHAKVIRGINVTCSITAPRYLWSELDTYRVGTERLSSESTMHCEAKGLSGVELQKFKSKIEEGLDQERIQMFSYQTLRRIYFQRKSHRLPEWRIFCNWIKTLPLAEELILIERNKKEDD